MAPPAKDKEKAAQRAGHQAEMDHQRSIVNRIEAKGDKATPAEVAESKAAARAWAAAKAKRDAI